jgi:hypothetical protein
MLAQAPMVQYQAHRPATDVRVGPAYPAVLFSDQWTILTPMHGGSGQIQDETRNTHAAESPKFLTTIQPKHLLTIRKSCVALILFFIRTYFPRQLFRRAPVNQLEAV